MKYPVGPCPAGCLPVIYGIPKAIALLPSLARAYFTIFAGNFPVTVLGPPVNPFTVGVLDYPGIEGIFIQLDHYSHIPIN